MTKEQFENLLNSYDSIEDFAEKNTLKLFSSNDFRYILNYDEIKLGTPKNEISHKCRGSVYYGLPKNYKLIARTFDRFFNEGEKPEYLKDFIDYSKEFYTTKKEDGSLILLYNWNGNRVVNTRGSFGEGEISKDSGDLTYRDLFRDTFTKQGFSTSYLDVGKTYIFELCSPYNQVVDYYSDPVLFHITTFFLDGREEDPFMNPVVKYECKSIEDIYKLVKSMKSTNEGVVVCQRQGDFIVRKKIKTESWVRLSHLSEGVSKEKLRDVIIKKEKDEIISVFPYLTSLLNEMDNEYNTISKEIKDNYEKYKDIQDQKEFALSIKDLPYKSIYFQWRKTGVDYEGIDEYFIKFKK